MPLPRPFRTAFIAASICVLTTEAHSQSVVLWRGQPNLRGTWREETRIEVNGMTLKTGSAEQAIGGTGNFAFLEILERDLGSPTRQEVVFLNSSTQGTLAILGNAGNDIAQGSVLLGKKIVGKRERDQWVFEFKDVKPSLEEQKALDSFGKRTATLAFLPYLYGTQSRRKGETWKADTTALTKDAASPLTIDLTFKLEEIGDHLGVRCANVAVAGFVKAPFGANNAGSLKLDVQGNIWRDVRDLVDVDANLRGSLSITGIAPNRPDAPAGVTTEITAPFTLSRTVKQVKR
jgi:hypothetical protein